jgi:hypothetical protein
LFKALKDSLKEIRKKYKNRRETPQYWEFAEDGVGYIQIPKVASRSMRKAFSEAYEVGSDEDAFLKFESLKSAHVKQSHIRQSAEKGTYICAFVRDPLARLYSAWTDKVVKQESSGEKCTFSCHGIDYGMSFHDFVRRVCQISDKNLERHLKSQAWFLTDDKGLIPHYIGKLESFDEDYAAIRNKFPRLKQAPHANKSVYKKSHLDAYDSETLAIAIERYKQDFELFGYRYPS